MILLVRPWELLDDPCCWWAPGSCILCVPRDTTLKVCCFRSSVTLLTTLDACRFLPSRLDYFTGSEDADLPLFIRFRRLKGHRISSSRWRLALSIAWLHRTFRTSLVSCPYIFTWKSEPSRCTRLWVVPIPRISSLRLGCRCSCKSSPRLGSVLGITYLSELDQNIGWNFSVGSESRVSGDTRRWYIKTRRPRGRRLWAPCQWRAVVASVVEVRPSSSSSS